MGEVGAAAVGARNILVNVPGVFLAAPGEAAGAAGAANKASSFNPEDTGAGDWARGALNMLVNSPGSSLTAGAAGGACCKGSGLEP